MGLTTAEIPNDAITQLDTATERMWYKLGDGSSAVTVTVGKNKHNQWAPVCHSCQGSATCVHSRRIMQYITKP